MEKQIIVISSDEFKNIVLKNDNIAIYKDEKLLNQVSIYKIFCIFVFGDCTITTKVINRLLEFGISIYFMNSNLKPKFVIGNQLEGNYLLRQKQYNFEYEFELSKIIVKNKVKNQIGLLKDIRNKNDSIKQAINKIKELIHKVDNVENQDSLRGIEGNISKIYFGTYFCDIGWYKRMPRTKIDIVNILLDIGYTFLYNFLEANLNIYGFDIYKGFYHKLFFERKSLVCDIVEPFRCIVDKQLRKMYNLSQVNQNDFKFLGGEYVLKADKRGYYTKLLMQPILEHKENIFNYVKNFYMAVFKGDIDLIQDFIF